MSEETSRKGAELGTVIVNTTRMEELARFYRAGLELGFFTPVPPRHMGQRVGAVYLGFDRVDEVRGGHPGAVSVWFTVSDLQATFDRFVSLGAEVISPPTKRPWGATLAAVRDLDGNTLGLAQR